MTVLHNTINQNQKNGIGVGGSFIPIVWCHISVRNPCSREFVLLLWSFNKQQQLMEAILDFSQPFNPTLLDQIISVFYNPQNPEVFFC